MADQIKVLDRGADVLIATPGRLLDVFGRGHLVMSDIRILVIDEADRMLDMGFIPDVERIVSLVARKRQTLLFSATMPPEIRRLADAFLDNPKEIAVSPPATPAETVEQGLVIVADAGRESHRVKRAALRRLIDTQEAINALIFCNRKRDVGVLQRSLHRHGYDAAMLHGDMPQPARTEVLGRFRRGEVAFLVCSDVAARGLDIAGIDCVFNFDVPINAEDYIHRIGRTGRAGRPGRAFTLATPGDGPYVAGIEHLIGKTLPRITVDGIADAELEAGSRRGRRRGRGRATAEASPKRAVAAPSAPRPAPARAESPPRTEPRSRAEPPPRTEPRSRTESRRRREPAAPDVPVVGMGDHVPAFLLREAKVPPAKRTVETDVDENAP
jgi:superfamily II DNA/RNA helicase